MVVLWASLLVRVTVSLWLASIRVLYSFFLSATGPPSSGAAAEIAVTLGSKQDGDNNPPDATQQNGATSNSGGLSASDDEAEGATPLAGGHGCALYPAVSISTCKEALRVRPAGVGSTLKLPWLLDLLKTCASLGGNLAATLIQGQINVLNHCCHHFR